jgi:hypothetical protein
MHDKPAQNFNSSDNQDPDPKLKGELQLFNSLTQADMTATSTNDAMRNASPPASLPKLALAGFRADKRDELSKTALSETALMEPVSSPGPEIPGEASPLPAKKRLPTGDKYSAIEDRSDSGDPHERRFLREALESNSGISLAVDTYNNADPRGPIKWQSLAISTKDGLQIIKDNNGQTTIEYKDGTTFNVPEDRKDFQVQTANGKVGISQKGDTTKITCPNGDQIFLDKEGIRSITSMDNGLIKHVKKAEFPKPDILPKFEIPKSEDGRPSQLEGMRGVDH